MVAVLGGGLIQAHYRRMGLDMGRIMVAHGGYRRGDGENQSMTRLERDWVQGVKVDTA